MKRQLKEEGELGTWDSCWSNILDGGGTKRFVIIYREVKIRGGWGHINWQQIVVYGNDSPRGPSLSWWHWSKLHCSRCILRMDNEMCAQGRRDCGFYDAIELPEMSVCVCVCVCAFEKAELQGRRKEKRVAIPTQAQSCLVLLLLEIQPKY